MEVKICSLLVSIVSGILLMFLLFMFAKTQIKMFVKIVVLKINEIFLKFEKHRMLKFKFLTIIALMMFLGINLIKNNVTIVSCNKSKTKDTIKVDIVYDDDCGCEYFVFKR